MRNLDLLKQQRQVIASALSAAIAENDEAKIEESMKQLSAFTSDVVLEAMRGTTEEIDRTILSGRGVRQLTSEEIKYYQKFIEAAKSSSPKQAIANIDVAFPETIIDSVLEDIVQEHPLLSLIDFQNTGVLTKWIINAKGTQLATWGRITSAITAEISGAIDEIPLDHNKLSAFMCVSMDIIEAGPAWVDRYVRAILGEALALAEETAAITGTGKDMPIGMDRDLDNESNGTYAQKTPVPITDLSIETIGKLKEKMAKVQFSENEVIYRKVNDLVFIVNPADYYGVIEPASKLLTGQGYVSILPEDMTIVPSNAVATGYGVIGIAKKYFMGVGTGKEGKIVVDDSIKFFEDERAFKIILRGNGRAHDNSAFLRVSFIKSGKAVLAPAATLVKNVPAAE